MARILKIVKTPKKIADTSLVSPRVLQVQQRPVFVEPTVKKKYPKRATKPHANAAIEATMAEHTELIKKARANGVLTSKEAADVCGWALNTWYIYQGRQGAPEPVKRVGVQRYYAGKDVLAWAGESKKARLLPLKKSVKP